VIDEDRECKKNLIERSFLQRRRETATLINLYFGLFNLILISIIFLSVSRSVNIASNTFTDNIFLRQKQETESRGMQASG